jgi:hypothetical protein
MTYLALRRFTWKPWNWSGRTWGLAIIAAFLVSPFVTRWICLWQVPDVALPFDVEEVVQREIHREDDAMARYAQAMRLFNRSFIPDENSFNSMKAFYAAQSEAKTEPKGKWDKRLDRWLERNKEALEEYRLATEMTHASRISSKSADGDAIVGNHQMFRELVRLAELEAIRHERRGDLDVAWGWHLANLRCVRHCQIAGHAIGISIRNSTYLGIARWAEYASLNSEQLQVARQELLADRDAWVSRSELLTSNYLKFRDTMNGAEAPNHLFPFWRFSGSEWPLLLFGKRIALWSIGQPDIVMRLARQELVNNLQQIELPLHLRCRSKSYKNEIVFLSDHKAGRASGQLDPFQLLTKLEAHLEKMPGLEGRLLGGGGIDRSNHRNHAARKQTGDVALAAHQYQRRHGEFPATVEQLVPEYLETIPFDPMSEIGVPIQYRREEGGEAIVWSIGYNGSDDGGDILGLNPKDIGFRIQLNRQVAEASEDRSQEKGERESSETEERRACPK